MNISLENIDKVSARLTLKMEKADYQENVDKSLKNVRQKAQIPGFRPGQVPMSLVEKRFGREVRAEEINKLLGEKLYAYIKENKVQMLGEPLTDTELQKPINFDSDEEMEFVFDIAIAPEVDAKLTGTDSVDYYRIKVDDKMLDDQVNMYAQRAGNHVTVDSYQEKDMLKGLLVELDEKGNTKEGGVQVEGAVMMPDYMKDDKQKKIFDGCKVNDVLTFNPAEAYKDNAAEIASLLKINKEDVPAMKSDFSYQIQEITRYVPAEVNQDLFDKVFGEGNVKSEEEFRGRLKALMEQQFTADEDYKFMIDVRTKLMARNDKLQFPDELLKRIMKQNSEDKGDEFIEKNYAQSIEGLTWQLIREDLVKEYGIKVDDNDVKQMAKEATRAQFAQYGMASVPDELIEKYAADTLKKREQVDSLVNRCIEIKLADTLKKVVKLNEKEVTVEEFNKLFD